MPTTTKRTEANLVTEQRPYVQINVEPALHNNIRTEAKSYGLTTGGFVAWMYRTWKNADAEARTRSLSLQSTKS